MRSNSVPGIPHQVLLRPDETVVAIHTNSIHLSSNSCSQVVTQDSCYLLLLLWVKHPTSGGTTLPKSFNSIDCVESSKGGSCCVAPETVAAGLLKAGGAKRRSPLSDPAAICSFPGTFLDSQSKDSLCLLSNFSLRVAWRLDHLACSF